MQEISFELRDKTLRGWSTGKQGQPVILALHGWLDNAASFEPLAGRFTGFQLIAIDLPGHGLSDHRSSDAHYHLMDWVQDVHGVVESLDCEKVIVLGHSMGGIIGSLYASCFPEKVSTLISIEAVGPLTEEPGTSAEQLRKSVLSRIEIEKKTPRHPKSMEQAIQARMLAGGVSRDIAERLVKRNLHQNSGELKWRSDRRLRTVSSLRMVPAQAETFIRNIQCPVLIISGDQGFDKIKQNLSMRMSWFERVDNVQLKGGHHAHMDSPEETAHCIRTHLQKLFDAQR